MTFASEHKDWYTKLDFKAKLFEIVYAKIVARLISRLTKNQDFRVFNNSEQITNWSSNFINYFETICIDSKRPLFSEELTICDQFARYSGHSYHSINNSLRLNDFTNNTINLKTAKALTQEIDSFSTRQYLLVSRRLDKLGMKDWLNGKKLRRGLILSEAAFVSTSLNLYSRYDFENTEEKFTHNNITFLLIEVPIGTKAIYTSAKVERPSNEYELLIQKGTNLLVRDVIKLFSNTIVTMKIVE